jgi:hypothetical protein
LNGGYEETRINGRCGMVTFPLGEFAVTETKQGAGKIN